MSKGRFELKIIIIIPKHWILSLYSLYTLDNGIFICFKRPKPTTNHDGRQRTLRESGESVNLASLLLAPTGPFLPDQAQPVLLSHVTVPGPQAANSVPGDTAAGESNVT